MANFDDFKLSIEALSGGKNTVLFDDVNMPSVMVPFPKLAISDVISGGSSNAFPAFSVNSVEKDVLYFSKFHNIAINERGYSLPMRDPKCSIDFDTALTYCRNKGDGWCLTPYSLWCAVALWCRTNGTMPRGNNNYGADISYSHEKGVPSTYDSDGAVNRTLTGSGPATWYHNWMPDGIADLNGNVWDWCAGMRIYDGEIQVIPYANCFDQDISLGASSTAWKAILADGSLVDPGTSGTLKWDYVSSEIVLTDADELTYTTATGVGCSYTSMTLGGSLEEAPEIAKALLLYPDEPGGDYGSDRHYYNPSGERMPICGGSWTSTGNAGVFYVDLYSARSGVSTSIGFRATYCDM